jgi:hypothetical protein
LRDVVPDVDVPVLIETLHVEQVEVLVAGRRNRGHDVGGQSGIEQEGDPKEAGTGGQEVGPGVPGPSHVVVEGGDPSTICHDDRPEDLREEHRHEEHGERQAPRPEGTPRHHQDEEQRQERVAAAIPGAG